MTVKPYLLAVSAIFMTTLANAKSVQPPDSPSCDRKCLEGHLDAYLTALTERDPNLLPLTPDAKFTENGVHLPLGDAAWGTATHLGKYRIVIADEIKEEVAFMGVVYENHTYPGILNARLKIDNGRISEIETIWVRNQAAAKRLEAAGSPRKQFLTPLPAHDRPTREKLVAIANRYFNGLQDNDGMRYVPFTSDCHRMENGTPATNVEVENNTGVGYSSEFMRLGCTAQFRSGLFRSDTDLRERRFRVVDLEYGLVFVFVFFDHNANLREYTLTDGTVNKLRLGSPQTWQVAELFKIEGGKISQVEAYLNDVPYGMSSGWHDCSGVFPFPCNEPGAPYRKIRVGHDYADRPGGREPVE